MEAETVVVLCRFACIAAGLLLWGTSAYLFALVPRALRSTLWSELRACRLLALLVLALAAVLSLPAQTALIGNGWADSLRLDMLHSVALETSPGTTWVVQCIAVAFLLLICLLPGHRQAGPTALGAAMLIAGFAASGHAAMHEGTKGLIHQANDFLHLLSAGAWVGALVPVALIFLRIRRQGFGDDEKAALWRFSTAGHIAVGLVLLSGAANLFLVLGTLPSELDVTYQKLLGIKILLVFVMSCLALANRYVFAPQMAERRDAAQALMIGTISEIVIAVVVVALVAWFGTLPPR